MQNRRGEPRALRSERRAAKLRNQRIIFILILLILLALIAYVAYTALQRGAATGLEIEGLVVVFQMALPSGLF
jgi:hypothetical protein